MKVHSETGRKVTHSDRAKPYSTMTFDKFKAQYRERARGHTRTSRQCREFVHDGGENDDDGDAQDEGFDEEHKRPAKPQSSSSEDTEVGDNEGSAEGGCLSR